VEIFNNGNNISGNIATIGMGKASVTHKLTIRIAMESTVDALFAKLNGLKYQKATALRAAIEITSTFLMGDDKLPFM